MWRELDPAAVSRVVVVGCSGSGKSILSRALARRIDAEHVELDGIYNLANWRERDRGEMERVVKERIQAPRWVVDGNYNWLAETVWPLADVVLFLDPGRGTVMRRIALRSVARVITRRRLWNGNRERWSSLLSGDPAKSIIVWAWRRHPHYRRLYREMMSEPSGSKIVHFTSPTAVREFVRAVPAAANGGAG